MPPKIASKERAWGTRYDTLELSPPASPHPQNVASPMPVSPGKNAPANLSTESQNETIEHDALAQSDSTSNTEKMPHDASVFVGSLPTNMDHAELTHRLSEHLAEHTEIKNIKVIRDNKGGVCAFVQCEDASAAGRLIQTLQTLPPRPFLGRILRYEAARAFRTLLISYRTPNQIILPNASIEDNMNSQGGRSVTMEPADAMRIYRCRNAKYLTVTYNAEALNFDAKIAPQAGDNCRDSFDGEGLLLSPLKYDAETIQILTKAFGPVERIAPYSAQIDAETVDEKQSPADVHQPSPHDAPRSADMDPTVWEIKWAFRDDCVNALMTLRRVPHLTVSWAHHPPTPFIPGHDYRNTSPSSLLSARFPLSTSHARISSHAPSGIINDYQPHGQYRSYAPSPGVSVHSPFPNDFGRSPNTDVWSFAHSTPLLRGPSSPYGARSVGYSAPHWKSPKWSENDHPSLKDGMTFSRNVPRWADRDASEGLDNCKEETMSSESQSASAPVLSIATHERVEGQSSRGCLLSMPSPQPLDDDNNTSSSSLDSSSTSPTPEPSLSPITPVTPKHTAAVLRTPKSSTDVVAMDMSAPFNAYKSDGHCGAQRVFMNALHRDQGNRVENAERELDPTTIFVGGLEMYGANAWNEARLQDIFGRFGKIEDIQFVRPFNKRSAFAFIKFDNTDSPARAVIEEHNRIHDGRHIRVQLRDTNPPQRIPWKPMRGRGRFVPFGPTRIHIGDHNETIGRSYVNTSTTDAMNNVGSPERARQPTRQEDVHNGSSPARLTLSSNSRGHSAASGITDRVTVGPVPGHSPNSSNATKLSSQFDLAPEQSANTTLSLTPPPSANSIGPSASIASSMNLYSVPSHGYYPSANWMHPYPQQYPYPPFLPGYGGYSYPSQHSQTLSQSDSGGSMQSPWVSTCHNYKHSMTHDNDQGHSTAHQANTQPPLRPTGFIQGQHGTLIPIYHPEALDQYMANSQQTHTPPPFMQPQNSMQPPPWAPYPQGHMYPYAVHMPPLAATFPQQRGWMPSSSSASSFAFPPSQHALMHNAPVSYGLPASSSSTPSNAPPFRHAYPGTHQHGHRNTPPPSKRYNRRDNNQHFNPNRMGSTYSMPNRFVKAENDTTVP